MTHVKSSRLQLGFDFPANVVLAAIIAIDVWHVV